jgi:hypothetical protein
LTFASGAVSLPRWQAIEERLGRFFGPGLRAELAPLAEDRLSLTLAPLPAVPDPIAPDATPPLSAA